jgi:hypothetical protein
MAEDGAVIRRADIPVAVGKAKPDTARRWLREQIPYRNFAGMAEGLDRKIETFVTNHRERFRGRMSSIMERWAVNWAAANGESMWRENEDDVHIPETKKALDAKVVRIEEALTQFDPIFEVKGRRGDLPRYKAQITAAYTHSLMDLANFRDMVQPAARDAELCNIAAIKVEWEHRVENVVDRKIELRFREDGTPYYHDERRYREAVVRSGPRFHLVDPFWFFYDLDAPNVQECEFIGDESEMFLHELEAAAENGIFSKTQVEKVRSRRAGHQTQLTNDGVSRVDIVDQQRSARSIASSSAFTTDGRGENNAMKCRVIECWAYYDFEDGFAGVVDPLGRKLTGVHRVVATLANGICVRFQLNPFDRKFVPYAVCRVNRNGHEMVAPSNFDHVVQLNAQYDSVRSNILRMLSLAVAPVILAGPGSDLPDSILNVLPGSVIKGAGSANDWDLIKMPEMAPQTVAYHDQYYRTQIEEVSGAMRVYEQPQGTATETERKVQEQQRMVRSSIIANGAMWKQAALITYWMSAQFATQPERFSVVGKAASVLGKSALMTPDMLQEDIDIEFIGLQSLHTFGNRLTGIRQWMNNWGKLLPNMPGVNLMALARQDFELSVGRSNIDEIFTEAIPPWDSMPQEEENVMILAGHQVPVSKTDDDLDHLKKLASIIKDPKVPAYVKMIAVEHANEHAAQLMQKNAMLQAPGGGQPGQDRAPASGGMPAQQKGVTPGPTQERTVSKTGRDGGGISQSQSMSA